MAGAPVPSMDSAKWGRRVRSAGALGALGLVVLAAASLLSAGPAAAQTPYPGSGDWYVATSTTLSGQQVTVTGDVTVPNGVTLDLTNVDLRIGGSFPGQYGILVEPGATLNVQGGVIQAASAQNTYRFVINGSADIEAALIQHMWGSNKTTAFGVQIYSSTVTISNSTIQFGTRGNVLIGAGSPTLVGNRVQLSRYAEISQTNPWTCRVDANWEANGIMVTNGSHPTLTDNVIVENGQSSSASDFWPQYLATINLQQCSYVYVYENILGYGLRVESAAAEVTGGLIDRNSWIDNAGWRQVQASNPAVYLSRYPYNQQTNPYTHSAGLMLSAAGGNYTHIGISDNYDMGLVGNGGSAFVSHVTIGNHTQGAGLPRSGVGIGNGINLHNATLLANYYHITIFGTGVAWLENLTFGTPLSTGLPAIYVDWSSNGATIKLFNTTFPSSTQMPTAIQLSYYGGHRVDLYNCTIRDTQINDYGRGGSTITAYWIFQATATWANGAPVVGALAMVTSPFEVVVMAEPLDGQGTTPERWLIGFQRFTGSTGGTTINSPLRFRVYANGTISDTHEFVFNGTTRIEVQINDPFAPSLAVYFPADGARFNTGAIAVAGNSFDVGAGVDYVEFSTDGGQTWQRTTGHLPDWRADLVLEDGVHDVWVRSVDKAGGRTSVNVTGLFVDTQAPVFEVWQPVLPATPGETLYTNATSVLLRGTAPADAYLTLNGEFIPVTGGQFSKQLLLREGTNAYRMMATDLVGNSFALDFLILSDTLRPSIFLSSPPENHATNRPAITIAGVTEVNVSLLLNGVPVPVAGGFFSLQYNLSEGVNTLRLEARDPSGNYNSLARVVSFDTVAPSILLESPTQDFVTNQREVEVRGYVDTTITTVYIDGAPVETVRGSFTRVVRLDEGENTVRVQAWDFAGNEGRVEVRVRVDSDPPGLTVTAPTYGSLVTTTTVVVKGSWTGDAVVTVDGVPVLSTGGVFEERVSLLEGANMLEVVALDAAGNREQYQILVYRDTVPPSLSVNLPQTKLRAQQGAYTVTGNVAGGVRLTVNDQAVAVDERGDFTVLLPLNVADNTFTFRATDSAGNTASSVHTIERVLPPDAPEGLFGMGEASYALLPAMVIAGVVGTLLLTRAGRRDE